ncbi:MAG TPA: hypothetical protein DCZ94_13355 [Lentisphaeria bacterium]|nr:MAG: hypothetical protein A2X48_15420 [Lentisphaerae bacterium GWF2_49_21]HBC87935.1 hypothetical protein [Lentisphaeria bacterium]
MGNSSHFVQSENIADVNDSFITVEGTFIKGPGGHMGIWAGEIDRVTKIEIRAPKEKEAPRKE